jgi:uncharacterized protein (TIGR02145 family)
MDNEKGKFLISTGSSNLAKTEKLLSITQKILSEIKPQYESVRIGNQEWITRNLDVDRFRNGDLVPHIESDKEWEEAGENGQPAWCYYDNDPEYGKDYGKLYNWYAVNDPRGLAPEGWHIPTDEEWTILEEFLGKDIAGHKLKSVEGWEEWYDKSDFNESHVYYDVINIWEYPGNERSGNGDNSSGFNCLQTGYRDEVGAFVNCRLVDFKPITYSSGIAHFWSDTTFKNESVFLRSLFNDSCSLSRPSYPKKYGFPTRCLKNSSESKWAQAIRAGNIKPYIPPGLKLK